MSEKEAKSVDPKMAAQITPELLKAIQEEAKDGRITCQMLRKLAQDLGLPYKVAGAAVDIAGIKVQNCELGCF